MPQFPVAQPPSLTFTRAAGRHTRGRSVGNSTPSHFSIVSNWAERKRAPLLLLLLGPSLHTHSQAPPYLSPGVRKQESRLLSGCGCGKALPEPLLPSMTAIPPCRKRCSCRSAQLLVGLLCSLAILLVLSFLATSRQEELLSRALPGVGERYIEPLLLPPPNAFPLSPSPCALTAPWLLVLVASATGHAAQRAAVRRSWGGTRLAGGHNMRTVFILGLPGDVAQQAALERESAEHGDLLQARFSDTYANLTLKTLAMLGWATTRCPTARFLLKADDDVILNLPALARYLERLAGPPAVYLGQVYSHVKPIRNPHSRHYLPTSLYPEPTFPPYCSGPAYVLSAPAAAAVLRAARQLPLLPIEDVFVALCTRHAGIAPRHLDYLAGATHYPPDACCYREVLFSVHEVPPEEMLSMWEAGEHPCTAWQRFLGLIRCKVLAWLAAKDAP